MFSIFTILVSIWFLAFQLFHYVLVTYVTYVTNTCTCQPSHTLATKVKVWLHFETNLCAIIYFVLNDLLFLSDLVGSYFLFDFWVILQVHWSKNDQILSRWFQGLNFPRSEFFLFFELFIFFSNILFFLACLF